MLISYTSAHRPGRRNYKLKTTIKTATSEALSYTVGNRALLGVLCVNTVIYLAVKLYYAQKKKSRYKKWKTTTEEERVTYLEITRDQGN